MRCNPLRWLWGLIPIALLGWLTVSLEHERIQNDLASRVAAALQQARLGWASAAFTGREGQIGGLASEDAEPTRAYEVARNVWGVRTLDNRAGLIEKADKYLWSAALRDNRLKLTGFVPSEDVRKTIFGMAQAAFPGREIQDQTKLARGAPSRDAWLGAIGFGLKQLTSLRRGSIDLDGLGLSIEGDAEDTRGYRAIRTALSGPMPQGVALKLDKVRPATVSPYVWAMAQKGRQVTVTGHVPSEAVRSRLAGTIGQVFRGAAIVDRAEIATGEPKGLEDGLPVLIAALGVLEESSVSLRDGAVTITGMAATDVIADAARQSLKQPALAAFRISEQIRFREVAPKPVSPFVTTINAAAGAVTLGGYVPSEAARQALVESVRARLPGRRITDELKIALGEPTGWQACVQAGLSAIGQLGGGSVAMSDRRMRLTGGTQDEALHGSLAQSVRASVDRRCDVDADLTLIPMPEPSLNWRALLAPAGELALEGEVPDEATKARLAALARQLLPSHRVVDRMRVNAGFARNWAPTAEAGLKALARLKVGEARLNGQALAVTGDASEQPDRSAAIDGLRQVGRGYTWREAISVLNEAEARRKAAEEAERQRQAAAAQAEAEARRKAAEEAERQRQAAAAQSEAEARRKAAEEAERQRQAAAAQAEAQRRAAAEAEARRKAEEERQRQAAAATADAQRRQAQQAADLCRQALSTAAREGVINFQRASADLDAQSYPTLDRLVAITRTCPDARIEVEGHTDGEGTADRNQRLSERRAQSVVDYLVRAGVVAERLTAIGYGAARPVAPNDTPANRARNRRIEFEVRPN